MFIIYIQIPALLFYFIFHFLLSFILYIYYLSLCTQLSVVSMHPTESKYLYTYLVFSYLLILLQLYLTYNRSVLCCDNTVIFMHLTEIISYLQYIVSIMIVSGDSGSNLISFRNIYRSKILPSFIGSLCLSHMYHLFSINIACNKALGKTIVKIPSFPFFWISLLIQTGDCTINIWQSTHNLENMMHLLTPNSPIGLIQWFCHLTEGSSITNTDSFNFVVGTLEVSPSGLSPTILKDFQYSMIIRL